MKNLLYLASGAEKKEYLDLPFSLICLVDHHAFRKKIEERGKFLILGMEAIEAIKHLRYKNLKFDYLVILNEGLYEGGGRYPLHVDLVLGYIMPILNDTYTHIMSPSYYRGYWTNKKNKINTSLDLPYEKKELFPGDEQYIDPKIFSNTTGAKVFLMRKVYRKKEIHLKNGKKIYFINDSFWNYCNDFDLIVTFFRGQNIDKMLEGKSNIKNYNVSSFSRCKIATEVVADCNHKKIAFSSFCTEKMEQFISFLEKHGTPYPEEIYVFYLNKSDYNKEY